jgi:hypothetical protein
MTRRLLRSMALDRLALTPECPQWLQHRLDRNHRDLFHSMFVLLWSTSVSSAVPLNRQHICGHSVVRAVRVVVSIQYLWSKRHMRYGIDQRQWRSMAFDFRNKRTRSTTAASLHQVTTCHSDNQQHVDTPSCLIRCFR